MPLLPPRLMPSVSLTNLPMYLDRLSFHWYGKALPCGTSVCTVCQLKVTPSIALTIATHWSASLIHFRLANSIGLSEIGIQFIVAVNFGRAQMQINLVKLTISELAVVLQLLTS